MKETPLNLLRENKLPRMVKWYDPRLLARVGVRTMVSSVFGQYADQRLVQAATDPAGIEQLKTRYDYSGAEFESGSQGAVWVDYIADTGDGFEPTYTMAYLLAQESLPVAIDGKNAIDLKAGQILIMGGDQCYPQATREDYKKKLVTPYSWAFDVPEPRRHLFAIPGNHDWYDGLAAFDSLFCSSRDPLAEASNRGTRLGGWQCQQHRSYWALKLPYNWWIWGTDIQFSKYLDSSQISYFELMAAQMKPGDNLIICIAEPSWMLSDFKGQDEEENFYKITALARSAGARIAAIVAGDWHHYARYYSPEHDVHFVTAGGGGSFLHPTHVLRDEVRVEWPEQDTVPVPPEPGHVGPPAPAGWHKSTTDIRLGIKSANAKSPVGGAVKAAKEVGDVIEEAVRPIESALKGRKAQPRILKRTAPKVYPEKSRSRLLSLRNLMFPIFNLPFAIGIGLVYWLITWEFYAVAERHDISAGKIDAVGVHTNYWDLIPFMPLYLLQALLVSIPLSMLLLSLWAVLCWYVDAAESEGMRRYLRKVTIGSLHWIAHTFTMFALGLAFVMVNNLVAPHIESQVNALWNASKSRDAGVAGRVAKEVLEPLSQGRSQQREAFGQGEAVGTSMRRSAPPASAMPGGEADEASAGLMTRAVRQVVGFVFYPIQIILLGGLAGGFVWGLYWTLTSIFLRIHAEDAFAALRIKHYKNFLRIKIEPTQLTIYPIGVDRIPNRRFWLSREGARNVPSHNPALIAKRPIRVRLIEQPIIIKSEPPLG